MKPRRRGEAQARCLHPGLGAHEVRLLAPLTGRRAARDAGLDPGGAFRAHELARPLQFGPRPVVIRCALQGVGSGVTQRLHLRVGQRQGADLGHQAPMLAGDPGKAIGKLGFVDRLLVENFEEPRDGFDREWAVGGDDRVQPHEQYRAISGRRRRGKSHQLRDLFGRQAADHGARADVDAAVVQAARRSERAAGLHAPAEPLRQRRRRNRICNQQDQKRASQLMPHSAHSGGLR